MAQFIVLFLLAGFVSALLGGAWVLWRGNLRLPQERRMLKGWHPLNPFYSLSPYHFGKR